MNSYNISRNYEKAALTGDEIASESQDLAYFHNAIFEKSAEHKVLASCVTFASPHRVPPGSGYNVSTIDNSEWCNNSLYSTQMNNP